jgi:hypothetical protein
MERRSKEGVPMHIEPWLSAFFPSIKKAQTIDAERHCAELADDV